MTFEPNPLNWSPSLRSLAALITVLGAIWALGESVTRAIYHFAEVQTTIVSQVRGVQVQLSETKGAIADANAQRDKSLIGLKGEIIPRIDKLEGAVHDAEREASAAKQRADDLKEQIGDLKGIAQQSLSHVRSLDDDIKATRRAVEPKIDRPAVP